MPKGGGKKRKKLVIVIRVIRLGVSGGHGAILMARRSRKMHSKTSKFNQRVSCYGENLRKGEERRACRWGRFQREWGVLGNESPSGWKEIISRERGATQKFSNRPSQSLKQKTSGFAVDFPRGCVDFKQLLIGEWAK